MYTDCTELTNNSPASFHRDRGTIILSVNLITSFLVLEGKKEVFDPLKLWTVICS